MYKIKIEYECTEGNAELTKKDILTLLENQLDDETPVKITITKNEENIK